jgi:Tfp pilus assembly protein PilF
VKAVCRKCGTTLRIPKASNEEKATPPSEAKPRSRRGRRSPSLPPVISMSVRTSASRDYLAIGVVVAAILVLLTASVWVIVDIHRFFSGGPGAALTQMIREITAPQTPTPEKPARVGVPANPKVQKRLNKGHRHFYAEQYQDALIQYQAAVDLDPKNADTYFWRGRARLKLGRYDRAVEDFNQVLVYKPEHRRACDNLGWLYMKTQDYEKSLDYLNKSLQLKPDHAWAYYTRSHVFFKAGRKVPALADARKACLLGYKKGCSFYEKLKE